MDNFEDTHEDTWWRDGEYNRDKFEGDLDKLVDVVKDKY